MGSTDLRPAAFIDRDGVINSELNYVHRIEDFRILPGVFEGLRTLQEHGFALIVVTNQAGIAKGLYTAEDFDVLTRHMIETLQRQRIHLKAVYSCPHHPAGVRRDIAVECDCRKPAPGMLLRAATEHGIDLGRSVMIGDKISDTQAGRAARVALTVLVESGHAVPSDWAEYADHRCLNLREAAEWLCAQPLFQNKS